MKVIEGRRVKYDSEEEFYTRQVLAAKPHDSDRIVRSHIAEALRFLMLGGKLNYTHSPSRALMQNRADSDCHYLPAVRENPFSKHRLSFANVNFFPLNTSARMSHFYYNIVC